MQFHGFESCCSSQIPILSSTSASHSGVTWLVFTNQVRTKSKCRHEYLLRFPGDGGEGETELQMRWEQRFGGPHRQLWSWGNTQNRSSWGKTGLCMCDPISSGTFPLSEEKAWSGPFHWEQLLVKIQLGTLGRELQNLGEGASHPLGSSRWHHTAFAAIQHQVATHICYLLSFFFKVVFLGWLLPCSLFLSRT